MLIYRMLGRFAQQPSSLKPKLKHQSMTGGRATFSSTHSTARSSQESQSGDIIFLPQKSLPFKKLQPNQADFAHTPPPLKRCPLKRIDQYNQDSAKASSYFAPGVLFRDQKFKLKNPDWLETF